MTSPVETDLAKVVDLLPSIEVVALYLGGVHLEEAISTDPHPRKNNVSGRANLAGTYHRLLAAELQHGLVGRDPDKARRIANEMLLHQDPVLRQMGLRIQEALGK